MKEKTERVKRKKKRERERERENCLVEAKVKYQRSALRSD